MPDYKLTLAYDGRKLCGWQAQPGVRTVQVEVEDALTPLLGGERPVVHGSGRTDSGVHALGQVGSFRSATVRDPEQIRMALNATLAEDIACVRAEIAPDGFHARFWSTGKTYRYVMREPGSRSPFWLGRALQLKRQFDWQALDQVLALYLGTHDFTAFQGPPSGPPRTPIRTIERSERVLVETPFGPVHHLTFEGPGFLRYQIRIMVGTALEVALGRRSLQAVAAALARGPAGTREDTGRTAPPEGLYLVEARHRGV